MTNPDSDTFALIRTSRIPGPIRADVLAMADAERHRTAIEQSKAQARELADQQMAHYRRLLADLCKRISRMATRMDGFPTLDNSLNNIVWKFVLL
jgi:hypothetical protein